MKALVAVDMKTTLDGNYTQLRIMQDQLGTLFHIIAVEDSDQLKKLAAATATATATAAATATAEWTQMNE